MKSLGLEGLIQEDGDASFFVKRLLALPFLPQDKIRDHFEAMFRALTPLLQNKFRAFRRYYRDQWLTRIGPEGFSVFGLKDRTNNVIESFHAMLRRKLDIHPFAWDFFCKDIKYSQHERVNRNIIFEIAGKILLLNWHAIRDLETAANMQSIRRHPRYATRFKNDVLRIAWRMLFRRLISEEDFMIIGANLIGPDVEKIASLRGEFMGQVHDIEQAYAGGAHIIPNHGKIQKYIQLFNYLC